MKLILIVPIFFLTLSALARSQQNADERSSNATKISNNNATTNSSRRILTFYGNSYTHNQQNHQYRCKNHYMWCNFYPKHYCYYNPYLRLRCPQLCNYNCGVNQGGEWGEWSKCSKRCGGGVQTRKRKCITGYCHENTEQKRKCNQHVCQVREPGEGDCSVTCGTGTMYIVDNAGKRIYSECNTHHCPAEMCPSGFMRKKLDPEQKCCKIEKNKECGVPNFVDMPLGSRNLQRSYRFTPYTHKRIFGGIIAFQGEAPWFAAIAVNGVNACGGSIITKRWILTASHCVDSFNVNELAVIVGRVSIPPGDPELNNRNVQKKFSYLENQYHANLDIGLIKLKTNLKFNSKVMPICLPGHEEPRYDSTCFVYGFGKTEFSNSSPNLLLADLEIFRPQVCDDYYQNENYIGPKLQEIGKKFWDNVICAGKLTSSQDSCNGDSGSALVCQSHTSCKFYVAGITSYGPSPCAYPKVPALYTRVLNKKTWIRKIISRN